MYLLNTEFEAFVRGQAAGLIPPDVSPPASEQEEMELIYHIGIMHGAEIGYRHTSGQLRVMALAAFTSEHLDTLIRCLPELKPGEVRSMTGLRIETYPSMLAGLSNYFSFGPKIISEDDLAGRISLHSIELSADQMLKGFEINYAPIKRPRLATLRQRVVLAEMILSNRLPPITHRQWENLTIAEASRYISSVPKPKAKLPGAVATVLNAISELKPEDRNLLEHLFNQKFDQRITA